MNSFEKALTSVIKYGVLIVPFLPFLVTDGMFFPYITGKNFVFRILVEILFASWLILVLRNRSYLPRRSATLWAMGSFFVAIFLATVFGINSYKSFWSNAERMEGLFGLLHIGAFFLITASFFKQKDWINFFSVWLVASVGVAIHGFAQHLGLAEIHQGGVLRVDANFGNATYFAIYAVFIIFLSLYFLSRLRRGEYVPLGQHRKTLMWGLSILVALFLYLLYFNATRGAMLGLIAGLLTAGALVALFSKRGRAKKWSLVGLAAITAIVLLFLAVKNATFVQESPVLSRFANISLEDETTKARFLIWGMSLEAWQERPVLGWGPENFTTIFARYYEPDLWSVEPWYDRAHNVFFDWLTSAGIVGLLAYLGMFAVAVLLGWRLRGRGDFSVVQAALFTGLLVAYFVHNIFVFDNLISYVLFFSVLGYLHSISAENKSENVNHASSVSLYWRHTLSILVVAGLVFSLYTFNIKPIKASGLLIDGLRLTGNPQLGRENVEQAQSAFAQAIAKETFMTTEIREQISTKVYSVTGNQLIPSETKDNFVDFVISELNSQVEKFPHDIRSRTFLATSYITSGRYEEGEEVAKTLVEQAPTRQLFHTILGEALFRQGDHEGSVEALRRAYELAPSNPEAAVNYAAAVVFAGRTEEAENILEGRYGEPEIRSSARLVQAYLETQNYAKARDVLEQMVNLVPGNLQYRFTLGQLYVRFFEDEKAIKEFEAAIQIEPALKRQIEPIIEQIKSGTIDRTP